MSEGHGSSQKPSARTKSSGQIPQLPAKGGGPPKPGSTSRIKPATVRASKAEVIASSGDDDVSELRMRVATPAGSTLGLSLRWKIVIATAAITIATAMLIFVTVKSKAETQLSDEVNAKGIRLVKTLASIDAAF